MIPFAVSDNAWNAITGSCVTIALAAIVAWKDARDKKRIDDKERKDADRANAIKQALAIENTKTSIQVKAVKDTLQTSRNETQDKLDALSVTAEKAAILAEEASKVGIATHILVNSNMGVQLRISAIALRRVAELTKNADDLAAADLADRMLKEHEAKQAIVDGKEKP